MSSYRLDEIAKEVIEVLAKHRLPILAVDQVFGAVREQLTCQTILPIKESQDLRKPQE